jgi:hypothetical protein
MSKKGYWSYILVLAIVFILLASLYYTIRYAAVTPPPNVAGFAQTPSTSTSSWKIYQDQQYGFQFQYPSDWTVNNQSYTYKNQDYLTVVVAGPEINYVPTIGSGTFYFAINIYQEGQNWSQKVGIIQVSPDGGRDWMPLNLSESYLESRPEFTTSQLIWQSFKG